MDTPAPSKERESNGFKIQRSNLRKIAELKQKLKALEKTTSTNTDKSTNKERESTSTTKNKDTTTDTTTTTKNKDDTKKKNPYEKRKPLNEKEKKFVSDLWYKGDGNFSGRDTFFQKLTRIYDKQGTPQNDRISRRRLWMWLRDQEVNQIHRAITKNSIQIKPILAKSRFERCQIDLVIKGTDSVQTHKAILTCVDVGTRMAFTRVLKGTKQKDTIVAMKSILDEAFNLLNDNDKQTRAKRPETKKSKTWSVVASDNGSEFGTEFTAFLNDNHIKHVKGVANKSTSQAMVERYNRTLQSSMQKEITATGAKWYDDGFVAKHTSMLNSTTNRNLRLRKDGEKTYTIYTPKELFEEDRAVIEQMFKNKLSSLGKANKSYAHEADIELGQTVRIVLRAKRKKALVKGFTPNWSTELYSVYKIKRPKDEQVKPYLYFVKLKSSGRVVNEPFTIQDIQVVHGSVDKPPSNIQVKRSVGTKTRSKMSKEEETTAKEQTSPVSANRKAVASKPKNDSTTEEAPASNTSKDGYVGRQVQSFIDYQNKEYRIEGDVVAEQRRKKGARRVMYYKIKWGSRHSSKYDYREHEWITKTELMRILRE